MRTRVAVELGQADAGLRPAGIAAGPAEGVVAAHVEHHAALQRHRLAVVAGAAAAHRDRDAVDGTGGDQTWRISSSVRGRTDDVGALVGELALEHRAEPGEVLRQPRDARRVDDPVEVGQLGRCSARDAAGSRFMAARCSVVREFAGVPRAERELASARPSATNKRDAGERDQKQGREHARDVELEARLQDLVGQARARAAGAGDELGHHRADQREAAGDAQAAEEIRQRARDAQAQQRLQRGWRGSGGSSSAGRGRRCAGRAWCWR